MNRKLIFTALVALGAAGAAQAQCACGGVAQVTNGSGAGNQRLTALLAGSTVCAAVGNERWQEYHAGASGAANNLIDYKLGPTHPVDPSKPVGSWTISGQDTASQVNYNYGSGGAYTYTVCRGSGSTANPGPPFSFCTVGGPRSITGATIQPGQGACP